MTEKNTIFDSRLREDEYIIWQGETKGFRFFNLRRFISVSFYISFLILPIFISLLIVQNLSNGEFNPTGCLVSIYIPILAWSFFQKTGINKYASLLFNTQNQYVISNQRVLFFKEGKFRETSLILMQDAVKTKPKRGKVNINLYDKRSPTGQLPAPIATLNNLSEEDAETAYDLLVKARDLSFEERIEDLGLE